MSEILAVIEILTVIKILTVIPSEARDLAWEWLGGCGVGPSLRSG